MYQVSDMVKFFNPTKIKHIKSNQQWVGGRKEKKAICGCD